MDELIADYVRFVAARGGYRADWFLMFMGLEGYPHYRESGRMGVYRGDLPLSDGAFRVLQSLTKRATENLESWDHSSGEHSFDPRAKGRLLITLTGLTLEELDSSSASEFLGTPIPLDQSQKS